VIKMYFRKMVQLSVLPLFLFSAASAEAKANRLLPISFVASRPQKKCSGDSKPAVLENLFAKIYQRNKDIFDKAHVVRENLCFTTNPGNKGRPAAFAISATGEISISKNLLSPNIPESVLAAIFTHELGHILLDHTNPDFGDLPYSYKKHLVDDPYTAKRYAELHEQLIIKRAWRGGIADPFQSPTFSYLDRLDAKSSALFKSIIPSVNFVDGGAFLSEPHYIAEAVYAEIFNLSDKGAFNTVSPDFARYVAGYKKTHNEVQDTLKEIALIEEKLLQKGAHLQKEASLRQMSEAEADEVGARLFLNSGFTNVFDGLLYLADAYIASHKNFGDLMTYCQWLETQRPLKLDSAPNTPELCWRIKNIRKDLNFLVRDGLLGPEYQDYMRSTQRFTRSDFSLATLGGCNAAPFKMPGAAMQDKVLFLTSGHCLGGGKEQRFAKQTGLITLKNSFADPGYNVVLDQVILRTQKGVDLGVLQATITYKELYEAGYPANELGDSLPLVNQHLHFNSLKEKNESRMQCQVEALVPKLVEGSIISENVFRLKKHAPCHFQPGDSGSVAIGKDGRIYGVAQTIYENGKACTADNPCEESPQGQITKSDQLYLSPVGALRDCYDRNNGRFDFEKSGCSLVP